MAYHRPGGNAPKSLLDKQEGWKMNLWMRSPMVEELFTSRYKFLKAHPHLMENTSGNVVSCPLLILIGLAMIFGL